MINKIYKIIHNKFNRFFKFIFFLRYLFVIFFVALVLFLTIPHFFDYKKKDRVIKNYLSHNYGLEIINIKKISYKSLPTPQLHINNLKTKFNSKDKNFIIKKLIIYPKLLSIYNYENFNSRKIKLEKSNLEVNLKDFKNLSKKIFNLKKRFLFHDLNLKIKENNKEILEIKKIHFSNFGYKKDIISGYIFNRKFKMNFKDDYNKIDFKLINTGISAALNISEYNNGWLKSGSLRGKILKSNFKLNFKFDENTIEVKEFFFRDKKLSSDSEGQIVLKPFFKINFKSKIKNLQTDLLKNFDIDEFLKIKELIKGINLKNHIIFESKKFNRNLINFFEIKSNLAYGRLSTLKNFTISDSKIICENNVNFLDEYPIIFFKCNLNSPDKRALLKKIKIDFKNKNETLTLDFEGNLNILSNKVNFDNIKMNNNYKATKEDLEYFKLTFEKILFDKSFIEIFNISKIRKFIFEIS